MIDKKETIISLEIILNELFDSENCKKQIDVLTNEIKINRLVNYYINAAKVFDEEDVLVLEMILKNLQYIYNNTDQISPVSDEDYDKLYEIYRDLSGGEIVGAHVSADVEKVNHKYPDLRGTLDKIHFITIEDKGRDKRKSLEEWCKSVENKLGQPLKKYTDGTKIVMFPKWDGLSVVHECDETGKVECSLTRGDTGLNEARDLTAMFKGTHFQIYDSWKGCPFGVKTEVVMSEKNYEKLCKEEGDFKSPRSAVSSILNTKILDRKYLKYLTVIPLQLQNYATREVIIAPEAYSYFPYTYADLNDFDTVKQGIKYLKEAVEKQFGIPIDGVVIRLTNPVVIKSLGREDAINKYEVAYKFPPEQKKTRLKDVIFSVGLLGTVAPVGVIEPVKMKGNTITNVSLGSIDRFESLNLREGDEVIVKYDIIPYLDKDPSCESGKGKYFVTPEECPYCHSTLVKEPVLKCVNMSCDSRIIGKISNYVEKMSIANISIGIITTLYKEGILKSIEDLYRLKNKERQIVTLPGFGSKMFKNIISGIDSRREVYDYQLLGAIGIPDIGEKIFKKILNIYYLSELIEICIKNKLEKLTMIGGIKEKTATKIIEGIKYNKDLIEFLCSELNVKRDERKYSIKVCFTKVRDKDFEKYLESKNVLVLEKYSKDEVDLLIIPSHNTESDKINKARKHGKEIVTIEEAYKMFGYER